MADTDTKAIADFYAGLSDEDRQKCAMDVLLYGGARAIVGSDGVKRRVPPDVETVAEAEKLWAAGNRLGPGQMLAKWVSRDELLKLFGEGPEDVADFVNQRRAVRVFGEGELADQDFEREVAQTEAWWKTRGE